MEKKTFVYKGKPVSYTVSGSGPALLLLHGWGSSAAVMAAPARALQDIFTCYALDFPGFGDSSEPDRAWSVDDYADLVEGFIEALSLQKPALLCHSFGGRVALKLLARPGAAEKFGKVLLTGGAGMKPKRSASFYVRRYTAKALKFPFELLPGPLRERGLAWVRSTSLWKKLGSSDYSVLSGIMRETFVKTVSEFLEPCLPKIRNEVFLLWGRNDTATPLYQAERMEKGIKGAALVVIDDAGHYAFLDQPASFNAIARAFFTG
jgi:pimeloyl-ACP methyl ester carboxylesterase